ncbi:MAG: bifunctional glutamate N-acetyltransferase/amino-acid acetyltransferase ArgJ [Phycisphaerales bacterium]|nr:bifunctional glutamate N-acetyltransferase/amino-acid acetyltransferase ArgJ [Phycisphaerales bacterium]
MKNETITAPLGFRCGSAACGIKASGKLDMGVLVADEACTAAAMFTRNRFCGSPVTVGREYVRDGRLRAIVVNSGCSNVATGRRGVADARQTCVWVAEAIDARPTDILPASTGIIGAFLPMDKMRRGIDQAVANLSYSAAAGRKFARAIMTTDLKPKQACARVRIGKTTITLAGCCKGSGMIAPNMATMLAFLTTDAKVAARDLKRMLAEAVEPTFNRVTVDECPSTSDTVTILAGGAAGGLNSTKAKASFATALREVCDSLAYQIAADGEGATRVLEIKVSGAKTARDAHAAARAIAVSPLVKTAVHGGDPNWGRIVQALGATDVAYSPERVTVRLGNAILFRHGAPAKELNPKKLSQAMRRKHVTIAVDLAAGRVADRVLTCDFSREYIAINADYHT